jgi:hypothetical protein
MRQLCTIVFLKPVCHFNRIVTYRSIFFCVKVIYSSTLSLRKQRNTLRFGTIRLKWKTAFSVCILLVKLSWTTKRVIVKEGNTTISQYEILYDRWKARNGFEVH